MKLEALDIISIDMTYWWMRKFVALVMLAVLAGCATGYHETSLTGGFDETHLKGDVWRVSFDGNSYTSHETAKIYWQYRSAELTLAQGFDGFEIVSSFEFLKHSFAKKSKFSYGYIRGPSMSADVRLLKRPFTPKPPIIFDARELKSALEPFVTGGEE